MGRICFLSNQEGDTIFKISKQFSISNSGSKATAIPSPHRCVSVLPCLMNYRLSHVSGHSTRLNSWQLQHLFETLLIRSESPLWVARQQQPCHILGEYYKTGWKSTAKVHLPKHFTQNKPNSSCYTGARWSHLLTKPAGIYSMFWKAAVTAGPQPGCLSAQGQGLPGCSPPRAWPCRTDCKARQMTQAPRQGQAWCGIIFLHKCISSHLPQETS